jgi:signal transduction histidine kinase
MPPMVWPGNIVRHIRSEPDGSVWFSTDGGLTRYIPSTNPPGISWMNGQDVPTEVRHRTWETTETTPVHLAVEMTAGHRVRWRFGTPDNPGVWSVPVRDREILWHPQTVGTAVVQAQVLDRDLNASQVLHGTLNVHPVWYRDPSRMIPMTVAVLGVTGWVVYLLIHLNRQRRLAARLSEEARALESADLARMDFERRLIHGQEAERGRIARELHDSLGQELLLIRHAAMLASRATPETTPRTALSDIAERAARSIKEVRSIAYALRPQELDRYGMVMAMRTLCEERAEIHAVEITFHAPPEVPKAPIDTEIGLFRILQECLTNALKHADANRIECAVSPRNHGIELRVADDGRGFDPATVRPSPSGGLGLGGMRERARLLHGSLTVHSHPGKGTIVEVWIPLPPELSDPPNPALELQGPA